jgi:hypothetical protein
LLTPLYPNEANKPGYGQLYFCYSAEEATKQLENQSNQGCTAEVMHLLDEMIHKLTHLLSQASECVKRN